jgi:hypothetical protein
MKHVICPEYNAKKWFIGVISNLRLRERADLWVVQIKLLPKLHRMVAYIDNGPVEMYHHPQEITIAKSEPEDMPMASLQQQALWVSGLFWEWIMPQSKF